MTESLQDNTNLYESIVIVSILPVCEQAEEKILTQFKFLIPCVLVVKDERHKPKDILGDKVHVDYHKKEILLANDEVHRFAIGYHKTLRNKIK